MRVLILSYETINNVGEDFLGATTEWLVKIDSACSVSRAQLIPQFGELCKSNIWAVFAIPLQYMALKLAKFNINVHWLWILIYQIRLYGYYKELIKKNDKIILAVGMLKFKNQNFSYIYSLICKLATKYKRRVLFNAMSIAEEDEKDIRYHQIVEAINMPCVYGISTRDGEDGIKKLQKYYIKRQGIIVEEVGDPALWLSEIYNIKKNEEACIYGVNVIDPHIYERYKEEVFSPQQVECLYIEIIKELERKGKKWVLYSNGMECDYVFGKKIIDRLKLPEEKLLPKPTEILEYLKQIEKFQVIFGARLHADISAYSMGIPVVGLLWDKKLKYFGNQIGCGDLFIHAEQLNGNYIVSKMEEAINFKYDQAIKEHYKEKTRKFIKSFLSE